MRVREWWCYRRGGDAKEAEFQVHPDGRACGLMRRGVPVSTVVQEKKKERKKKEEHTGAILHAADPPYIRARVV